jgi:excisionase family DNA binding protein
MSETPTTLENALEGLLRRIIREEIRAAMGELSGQAADIHTKEWLNAGEAAQLYGLPKTWLEERGRAGDIARTKPGRYVLFKRRDVEEYLERHKKKNGEGA